MSKKKNLGEWVVANNQWARAWTNKGRLSLNSMLGDRTKFDREKSDLNRKTLDELPKDRRHQHRNPKATDQGLNMLVEGWDCPKSVGAEDLLLSCCTPLHRECSKHHGPKGDSRVTLGTCGAVGERSQMILVWVKTPGVGNAFYPRRLGIIRVWP